MPGRVRDIWIAANLPIWQKLGMDRSFRRLPWFYEHALAVAALGLGVLAGSLSRGSWTPLIEGGWCFFAIAWFPPACVEWFRRRQIPGHLVLAMLLAAFVGFDGIHRLYPPWGC